MVKCLWINGKSGPAAFLNDRMKLEEINRRAVTPLNDALAEGAPSNTSALRYGRERVAHWDSVARWMDTRTGLGRAYRKRLVELYRFLIPKGGRVLEIGCAQGDLLAALEPAFGVGVDFSKEMLERGRLKYPKLLFVEADAHALSFDEKFDVIILSDLVNDLWNLQKVLQQIARVSSPRTRVILNFYSRLWELPLWLAQRLGLAKPNLAQNWLTTEDVTALLGLANFEVIRHRKEVLLPFPVPLLAAFFNRYLVRIWPFGIAALTHIVVARPISPRDADARRRACVCYCAGAQRSS